MIFAEHKVKEGYKNMLIVEPSTTAVFCGF